MPIHNKKYKYKDKKDSGCLWGGKKMSGVKEKLWDFSSLLKHVTKWGEKQDKMLVFVNSGLACGYLQYYSL